VWTFSNYTKPTTPVKAEKGGNAETRGRGSQDSVPLRILPGTRARSGLVKPPCAPTVQSVPCGVPVIIGVLGVRTRSKIPVEPSRFSVKVCWALRSVQIDSSNFDEAAYKGWAPSFK
jgi:hypothetical protein